MILGNIEKGTLRNRHFTIYFLRFNEWDYLLGRKIDNVRRYYDAHYLLDCATLICAKPKHCAQNEDLRNKHYYSPAIFSRTARLPKNRVKNAYRIIPILLRIRIVNATMTAK